VAHSYDTQRALADAVDDATLLAPTSGSAPDKEIP